MANRPRHPRFVWEQALRERGPRNPTTRHVLHALATYADPNLVAFPSVLTELHQLALGELDN